MDDISEIKEGRDCSLCSGHKRTGIIKTYHMQLAHMGTSACEAIFHARYWWPQMRHDIRRAVKACTACQVAGKAKGSKGAS